MFSKTALIFLALGALYVNASTVPVAREPECEFTRSFPAISYHDLTLASFNSSRSHGPAQLRVGQTRILGRPVLS